MTEAAAAEGRKAEGGSGLLPGMLDGLRVIETADERGEYCGLILAGLGAEVIKLELPQGSPTRAIGPFIDDRPGPDRSLHFLAMNRGKRSAVIEDGEAMRALLASADIHLDATGGAALARFGLDAAAARALNPRLITARITPFGDTGPWRDFKGSDLVHLALGGIMMNCGYDAAPDGYDLPPIAPQLWHAYMIAGEQLAVGIAAALIRRLKDGAGQDVSVAIHEAVAKNTELDLMSWVMRRAPLHRQTARHAVETPNRTPNIANTKDGRWVMSWGVSARDKAKLVPFLKRWDMAADLEPPPADADLSARNVPGSTDADEAANHVQDVVQRFVRAFRYEAVPWRAAQEAGLLWAPVRKPHENAEDPHWLARGTFADLDHPELGRTLRYPVSKWCASATAWQAGNAAPRLDEYGPALRAALRAGGTPPAATSAQATPARRSPATVRAPLAERADVVSARGRPMPLGGVRIFDFSWFLASAGGTRFLASLGAEAIKVEWKENPDTRLAAMAPVGGRAARDAATGPLKGVTDPDMGGQFNHKNAGKRGLSLNIRHPKGLAIAKDLIRLSDVVAEGFSPGVLERLGLGWDVLRAIRPDIIYVQQSGMGSAGHYGRFRTVGPVAASFAGTTDMSGLPEPAMPAGWGYSYLDWAGAHGFALAILGALHHRERTGEGQWIDSSQCEAGIYQTAIPVLDWSANGRPWSRIGNRSPYKPAAPHGAYRCRGTDRWLAIACFDEAEWRALLGVMDCTALADDPRFATLADRLRHQDALDRAVTAWTLDQDAGAAMLRLQAAGVPAGLCQTAEDRIDHDPQLAALDWMTEVTGSRIGRWPVPEFPVRLERTPAHAGGPIDRGAPCYGEDNMSILTGLLGFSEADVHRLAEDGVL
ncbi:CaiB/BaiF CoA-transferase family protein [Prosthecodimorpha staleyi]|uniref:CoA transferase n=1 Tax=Prosthecodimorpha staleyi TaxID=2840188 RepID=A0A947D3L1_9HYPH|nr:CoA transferase [Prosthecodimorpha staleyi]MBT9290385.1 CoA transferase [Prosthecodimorpha staleyi]